MAPPAPALHTRASAPAAVPAEIRDEKDPERKAQLMRMHRLATARIRTSALRRRSRLLAQTIDRERSSGAPSERVRQLELEMEQLKDASRQATLELQRAQEAVSTGSSK